MNIATVNTQEEHAMSTYNIALNFEDGVTRVIQCDDDEKVTDAAFRQKINLPMDCRDGGRGTCKCFVEKGEYELEFYMDESMSDEEAEQGYALTCQMIPESGIRVVATALGGTEAPPPRIVPRNPNPEQEHRQDWYQTIVDQTIQSSLMKRYGTLDEQVGPILFLASEDASCITGGTVPVGGGDLG